MDELTEYEVDVNGIVHTVLLSAKDAKRVGARPVKAAAEKKPAAKPPARKG